MLKVGDQVKIITNVDADVDRERFPVGTIGIIVDDMSHDVTYCNPYQIEANGDKWWYKSRALEVI